METFLWCVVLIPLISIVDGGFIGWFVSLGSPIGAVVGVLITATILYGEVIYSMLFGFPHTGPIG